jgi:flagellar biosynthesis/type III secretory pathway protein FliH
MDGSNNLDDNFERYHDEYEPEGRDAFARGYQTGHEAGRHSAAADAADQNRAHQNGYDAGQADAMNGAKPDPRRYRTQFTTATESSFREGYEKGWHDARER